MRRSTTILFMTIATFLLTGFVFIILKLSNLITWSWWWVTSPFWVYALLVFFFVALVLWLNPFKD